MQPAIRFTHFVKTDRRQDSQAWLESTTRGDYVFDSGGWRDYATKQERGIEFEKLDDAKLFIRKFGGQYAERKIKS